MDTLITSYGGVGTTTLLDFVREYQSTNDPLNLDGLKHQRVPPARRKESVWRSILFERLEWLYASRPMRWLLYDRKRLGPAIRSLDWLRGSITAMSYFLAPTPKRALYIFGDPMDAVHSIFRHERRVSGYAPRRHCYAVQGAYRQFDPKWDLRAFLAHGKDLFQLSEHLHQWIHAKRDYPILAVHYEQMWDHIDEIIAFLGLPKEAAQHFPEKKERRSSWRSESPFIQDGLQRMYGSLSEEINSLPAIIRVC